MQSDAMPAVPLITPVVRQILEYVKTSDCRLDDRLPSERHFAQLLEISRNSLREAMKTLQALGVIEIKRGSGIYLRKTDFDADGNATLWLVVHRDEILDVLTVRETLELRAVELIPVDQYPRIAGLLRHCLDRVELSGDLEELRRHDISFHDIFRRAAANKILFDICAGLNSSLYDERRALFTLPGRMRQSTLEHRRIQDGFAAGSRDAVRQAVAEHLASTRKSIQDAIVPEE